MDDRSERERHLDALYAAVRDSATVDRQAAFDIAMNELEYGTSPEARHGAGVWWCDGGDGHVAAEIGHWVGPFDLPGPLDARAAPPASATHRHRHPERQRQSTQRLRQRTL
jgi:hypothetical protein